MNDTREYVCSYSFDGAEWSLPLHAKDEAEASRRMRAIGMTGRVDGELVLRVRAFPGSRPLLFLLVTLRNLLFGGRPA